MDGDKLIYKLQTGTAMSSRASHEH